MDKIAVTEAESAAYYDDAQERVHDAADGHAARDSASPSPTGPPAGQAGVNVGLDDEAKAKAEALRARVARGEDFAKIAAASSDAPSKANGGLIGPVNPDEMSPQLLDM